MHTPFLFSGWHRTINERGSLFLSSSVAMLQKGLLSAKRQVLLIKFCGAAFSFYKLFSSFFTGDLLNGSKGFISVSLPSLLNELLRPSSIHSLFSYYDKN